MIPAGYLAKRVARKPEFLKAPDVVDIFSVSNCVSADFAEYIQYWEHNSHWLFDSPEIIRRIAAKHSIALEDTSLFYYEVFELEYHERSWLPAAVGSSPLAHVSLPEHKRLEGFDVVTFFARNAPECSPLSCNSMAEEVATNSHCLFATFDEAQSSLNAGIFDDSEPGPYRIFAVYSVDWP